MKGIEIIETIVRYMFTFSVLDLYLYPKSTFYYWNNCCNYTCHYNYDIY